MTYTFVQAQGGTVGDSICEPDKTDLALSILEQAKAKENGHLAKFRQELKARIGDRKVPVIGITGTGGVDGIHTGDIGVGAGFAVGRLVHDLLLFFLFE